MTQERVVYLNGDIVPESKATISIRDPGFIYGAAVFDTARTFNKEIFKLEEHLDRFYKSMRYLRIGPGMTKKEMAEATHKVVDANLPLLAEDEDYWITQRATNGVPGPDGERRPTVIVACSPLPFKQRARYYRDGMQVVTSAIRRTPPESMSPRAKTHNYVNMILADQEAKSHNPDGWTIMLDTNGNLAEGIGSNIFIVRDGAIVTPREQFVLPGISRQTVIELAHELNIETQEADIDLYDAYNADEAFITSTSFCIVPIATINGAPTVETGIPGPVTGRLLNAYSGLVGLDIAGQYLAHLS